MPRSPPDGSAIRDYIHVTDLADAHVRALEYLRTGGDSVALNLGTGSGHSVCEVVAAADPTLAHSRLGRQPRLSALDTIIRTALARETRGGRNRRRRIASASSRDVVPIVDRDRQWGARGGLQQ